MVQRHVAVLRGLLLLGLGGFPSWAQLDTGEPLEAGPNLTPRTILHRRSLDHLAGLFNSHLQQAMTGLRAGRLTVSLKPHSQRKIGEEREREREKGRGRKLLSKRERERESEKKRLTEGESEGSRKDTNKHRDKERNRKEQS